MKQSPPATGRPDSPLVPQRLAALFVAGWLLLDVPLLRLWDGGSVFGLPRGPLALFAIWAALIGALAWILERHDVRDHEPEFDRERV